MADPNGRPAELQNYSLYNLPFYKVIEQLAAMGIQPEMLGPILQQLGIGAQSVGVNSDSQRASQSPPPALLSPEVKPS